MPVHTKYGFLMKMAAALGLVVLADQLFWSGGGLGSNTGLFALAWTIATLSLAPSVRHDRRAVFAVSIAISLSLALAYDPSVLAWTLFWTALAIAALMPRAYHFGSSGRWLFRLSLHAISSLIGPWRDLLRLKGARRRHGGIRVRSLLALLPLPILGGSIFLALFASANPVIGNALEQLSIPGVDIDTLGRSLTWLTVLTMVWATFRPRRFRFQSGAPSGRAPAQVAGVSIGSVTLSLIAFNALFALQNGLDLAFLWSRAPLPVGMTLAEYAHRGAYPLIATALLAGLFVLVTLRPGSETAAVPVIRQMVVLWVFQNVFLVASSILRTMDYIEAYSLTRLRIAALVWMGLVGIGLLLILWRLLKARSATWLINANAVAGGVVLMTASVADLGSIAAAWNVRHAREVGGSGAALDLCYLNGLGGSALVPVITMATQPQRDPDFAERVAWVGQSMLDRTLANQSDGWWTWRNARRLERVSAMMKGHRAVRTMRDAAAYGRDCDGRPFAPPVPSASDGEPGVIESGAQPAQALTEGASQ